MEVGSCRKRGLRAVRLARKTRSMSARSSWYLRMSSQVRIVDRVGGGIWTVRWGGLAVELAGLGFGLKRSGWGGVAC